MASQRFCLRWNNHQSNLLSVFDQLLNAGTFTDVTLAIDGQYLKAHKVQTLLSFFFVITNWVNRAELFYFYYLWTFFFCSFLYFLKKIVSYVFLITFLCFSTKNMSDCDTFGAEQFRKCFTEERFRRYQEMFPHVTRDSLWLMLSRFPLSRWTFSSRDDLRGGFLCSLIRRKIWNIVKAIAVNEMFA